MKKHEKCRACGNKDLITYLDLGMLPLANNLESTRSEAINCNKYPLQVAFCESCGLSQLSIVVDPKTLFKHYVYRSSVNQGYVDHCRTWAKSLKGTLNEDSFVIDIAGNDGALLKEFKEELGCKVLNIDPAENLYKICEDNGVRMYCTFWGIKAAQHLINTDWPKADLITATNVFAHVDNIKEFLEATKMVLKPEGLLILEFPYLVDFIENVEFDTVYFEHLSYISIKPLHQLVRSIGLNIINIEKQNIHGGTVRVTISPKEKNLYTAPLTYVLDELEGRYDDIRTYSKWASTVDQTIEDFRSIILALKTIGKKVAAFAASAKGNTLLNCAQLDYEMIDYIIDETPEKIGKFSPGTGIEIFGLEKLKDEPPDYLVILSWNFKDEIIEKCKQAGYKGKYIIPIPKPEIL
jgi:cyclopropane fatty-acyl-phospholipid synthase-like methyltransferase